MIGKTSRGKGFYGTYRYLLREGDRDRREQAHIIGGNMTGWNAKELSREVRPIRRIKPHIKQPVWHVSLSFHPEEQLNDDQLQTISDRFLDDMGVDRRRHQHLYVRHEECEHGHVHLVVNRIADDGQVFDVHNDHYRTKATTRKLEQELGLRPTIEPGKDPAFRDVLQSHIDAILQPDLPLSEFCQQLDSQGITTIFTIRRGKLSGLSYHYQGSEVRGYKLGKSYSFPGLQREHGIDYQSERDDAIVRPEYVRRKGRTPPALLRKRQFDPQQKQINGMANFFSQFLEVTGQSAYQGQRNRVERDQDRLTLMRVSDRDTLLNVSWDEANQRWQPNEPARLKPDDISRIRSFAQHVHQQQADITQQQRERVRSRSHERELEL
ncbi:MAG: relaxase/mobilization nuclease domain-containing protein [Cyanobacteria bacterium J06627_28]